MILNSKEEPDSVEHPGTDVGAVAKEVKDHEWDKPGAFQRRLSIKVRGDLRSTR